MACECLALFHYVHSWCGIMNSLSTRLLIIDSMGTKYVQLYV